jgi:hypothetical protein
MCCWTHEERDRLERAAGIDLIMAESEETRCQCSFGTWCRRRMTQEDLLCDWCRGTDHGRACMEMGFRGMVLRGDPRVARMGTDYRRKGPSMAYPQPRSLNRDLEEGMADGKYQKVIQHRGGIVEKELAYGELYDLSDTYYGIHEAPIKRLPDGTVDFDSLNYMPTKVPVVGD